MKDRTQICSLLVRGLEKVRGQLSVISGWSQDAGFKGIDDISGVGLRVVRWEG